MSGAGPRLDPEGPPLRGRALMSQWWHDLAFVHWRVDPGLVTPWLPHGVRPDLFDGSAWVGLVPFRMVDAAVGAGPPVPWLGTFLETNVRTYSVDEQGRHGVVFCSLDCERLAAVAGARAVFGTPYRWARMRFEHRPSGRPDRVGDRVAYATSRRERPRGAGGRLELEVREPLSAPGDLEAFLTARFGLHTTVAGRSWWVPNTHAAWPLHRARVTGLEDPVGAPGLLAAAGFPGLDAGGRAPDSVLFSPGVRTRFGLPQRLEARGAAHVDEAPPVHR